MVSVDTRSTREKAKSARAPLNEAVKKPIALSAKESARVFLWIALADLGGFVFSALFSLRRLLVSSSGSSAASYR